MYGTGWQLSSNEMAQTAGRALGSQSSGCSTCAEAGTQAKGFRASVTGTVMSISDPPILEVQSVTALEGDAVGCMDSNESGGEGETETIDPTKSPTLAPVAVAVPTDMPVNSDSIVVVDTTNPPSTTDVTTPPTGSPTANSTLVTDSPTISPIVTDSDSPTSVSSSTPTGSTSAPVGGER
jgi:hypothetical protein